jgi:putative transposase
VTGWKLDPDGRHLTFTDGCGIGRVRLVGTRSIETFPHEQLKRVRLLYQAGGYYVQFCVEVERQITHQPTGTQVGIDVGLKEFYTDSDGATVHNPRFLRQAERRLKYFQRQVSRKSLHTKDHRKPGQDHQARKRQRQGHATPAKHHWRRCCRQQRDRVPWINSTLSHPQNLCSRGTITKPEGTWPVRI